MDICLKSLEFIRESITNLLYTIFDATLASANKQKLNALVLFIKEMSKLKQWKGLRLTLDIFFQIKSNL